MNQGCRFIISGLEATFGHSIFYNLLSSCDHGYQNLLPLFFSVLVYTPLFKIKTLVNDLLACIFEIFFFLNFITIVPSITVILESKMEQW